MLSPPDKRNRAKFYQFHKNHEHDTKQCHELKKAIEQAIKNYKLKGFINYVSAKRSLPTDNTKKPWHDDKKRHKSNSSSFKLKVINVIQDVELPTSRKQVRKTIRMIH